MQRSIVLGTLVGAGLLAITVMGQQPAPAVNTIDKVADNLYRIPGGGGNSAVFVRPDGVLLIDTKLANNGQAILDQIKKVTDKPVTHIINTHTHGDHTGSNVFFPAQVEIIAQENTKANMERMDVFKTPEGKVGLPDKTYKDHMTLFSGKQAVDLYYFGAAHTNGDTVVVFRDAHVMHAGDMFASKNMPLIDRNNGGSGVAYGETIGKAAAALKSMGIDKVITGHSDVMTWQDFVDFGEFNRSVLAYARASIAAGKTAEQAWKEYKLPEKFQGYTIGTNMMAKGPGGNFDTIYAELGK